MTIISVRVQCEQSSQSRDLFSSEVNVEAKIVDVDMVCMRMALNGIVISGTICFIMHRVLSSSSRSFVQSNQAIRT